MHPLELRLAIGSRPAFLTSDEDVEPAMVAEGAGRYLEIPQSIQAVHV
jgi:hypothetical protein